MPSFISQIIQQHPDAGYWHQQHPWFSIGHVINAANKKETPAFEESAQRTAVFFNDIPRLHWLLYQQDADVAAPIVVDNKGNLPEKLAERSTITADIVTPSDQIVLHEKTAEQDVQELDSAPPAEADNNQSGDTETPPADTIDSSLVAKKAGEPMHAQEAKQATTEPLQQSAENILARPALADEDDFEIAEQEEDELESEMESELIPLPASMLSESLAQAAENFKNEPIDEDALFFKTAYQHTIDYFASQGIKLEQEPSKDDRFGQQLKTFTSWLRHMKRLPDATVPDTDALVESYAAHSLQKGEVVTEPMADVLVKQGKNNQAITVLEKLRLLHPEKSHYFAARIEQIKHL